MYESIKLPPELNKHLKTNYKTGYMHRFLTYLSSLWFYSNLKTNRYFDKKWK